MLPNTLLGMSTDELNNYIESLGYDAKTTKFIQENPGVLAILLVPDNADPTSRTLARQHCLELLNIRGGKETLVQWADNQMRLADFDLYASGFGTGNANAPIMLVATNIQQDTAVTNFDKAQILPKYVAHFVWGIAVEVGVAEVAGQFDDVNYGTTSPNQTLLNSELFVEIGSGKLQENQPLRPIYNSNGNIYRQQTHLKVLDDPFWITMDNQLKIYVQTPETIAVPNTAALQTVFVGSALEVLGQTSR